MASQRLVEDYLHKAREEWGDRPAGPLRDIVTAFRMVGRIGARVTLAHAIAVAKLRLHHVLIDRRLQARLPEPLSGRVWLNGMSLRKTGSTETEAALPCAPVPSKTLRWALAASGIDPKTYHFVDIGSGWGYALLIASSYPFRRATGVEFARELHERACANIGWAKANGLIEAEDVELRYESALETDLPDGPTVFFLFHPFGEPVMREFLGRIDRSVRQNPRPVVVLYANPGEHHLFARAGATELPLRGRNSWLLRLLSPFEVRAYSFGSRI